MADIRLATDFFDHPKTMMLQAKHGAESVLCLQRLWCWAANNRSKGALRGIDKKAIALVARCADEVVDTFIELGFIDEHSRGYTLHNWKKNQGYVYHSEERSDKARKAAKARHSPKSLGKEACSEHASSIAKTESEQGYGDAPSPGPSPDPVPTPSPAKKIKTFVRPTLEQVSEYCTEKSYTFDPEQFIAFYESNGWKVGKNAMKSWQSACVTWQKREGGNGKTSQPTLSHSTQAGLRALQRISEVEKNGQRSIGQNSDEDF